MGGRRKVGRGLFALAAKVVVSGSLLYLAFRLIDVRTVGEYLRQADLAWVAVALVLFAVQVFVAAVRWRYVAAECEADVSLLSLACFSVIGAFFSQALPSTIGGDAVRIWLLGRYSNSWRAAAYSVLLDRFAGLAALSTMIVVSLPWSLQLISVAEGRIVTAVLGLTTACAIALFLLIGGPLPKGAGRDQFGPPYSGAGADCSAGAVAGTGGLASRHVLSRHSYDNRLWCLRDYAGA